jgi:hypothetical protein
MTEDGVGVGAPPQRRIGGRLVTPDAVLGADADCEALLDYLIAVYLGRDDFSSILIEDVLLDRLGHDKKRDILHRLLRRHGVDYAPYDTLPAELKKLRDFRNDLAHTVADATNPFHRIRRRGGQNELTTLTEDDIAAQIDRGMRCQSALGFLADLKERPTVEQPETSTDYRGLPSA